MTLTQMAPRRRNPKGGRHVNAGGAGVLYGRGSAFGGRVAGGRSNAMEFRVDTSSNGRRMQSAGHDAHIHQQPASSAEIEGRVLAVEHAGPHRAAAVLHDHRRKILESRIDLGAAHRGKSFDHEEASRRRFG